MATRNVVGPNSAANPQSEGARSGDPITGIKPNQRRSERFDKHLQRAASMVSEELEQARRRTPADSRALELFNDLVDRFIVELQLLDAASVGLETCDSDADRSAAILAGMRAYLLKSEEVLHSLGAELVLHEMQSGVIA